MIGTTARIALCTLGWLLFVAGARGPVWPIGVLTFCRCGLQHSPAAETKFGPGVTDTLRYVSSHTKATLPIAKAVVGVGAPTQARPGAYRVRSVAVARAQSILSLGLP